MRPSTKRATAIGGALATALLVGLPPDATSAQPLRAAALPQGVITPGLCQTTASPTSITHNIQGYAGGHNGTPSMTDEIITYIQNCTFSAPPLTIATQETCTPQFNGLNLWLSYYLGYQPVFVETKFIGGYCNSYGNANFVRDGYNSHDRFAKTYVDSHQEPGSTERRAMVCNKVGTFASGTYYAKYAGCSSHMAPNQTSIAGNQLIDYSGSVESLSTRWLALVRERRLQLHSCSSWLAHHRWWIPLLHQLDGSRWHSLSWQPEHHVCRQVRLYVRR